MVAPYNAVIGFPRWTEQFSLAGGAFQAAYPVANLATLPLTRVARSVDAQTASTQWVATSTTGRLVRLLGFVRHNAAIDDLFRITLYSDTGLAQLLHDTGWLEFWPKVYAFGSLDFGDPSFFTLKYSSDDIADTTWTRPVWLAQAHVARAIKVEIDATANPAGFFDCGLFEIAQGWQVSANFDLGAQYGFRARSQVIEALGGIEHVERRDKPRGFDGVFDYVPRDELLARGFELMRRHDLDTPFLWLPEPADPTHWLRNAYLARNAELGLMAYATSKLHRMPAAFKEVLG